MSTHNSSHSSSCQPEVDKTIVGTSNVDVIAIDEQSKEKKRRSDVWQHFSLIKVMEKGINVEKWKCIYCPKMYAKQKTGTTSQMGRHIQTHHYGRLEANDKKQKFFNPVSESVEDNELAGQLCASSVYDHSKVKNIIAKMIIVHEYPFMMVEHFWFNILMKSMNPSYIKISRFTIKDECQRVYEAEKEKLKKTLNLVERESLTCDCWTSNQTIGYMCLTAHFIDADWKLQSRIISFSDLDPPHSGMVISEAISEILLHWGIQNKISTITLDNASANDLAARNLKNFFSRRSGFQFMGEFFHVRCAAHILNLMVQDGLKKINVVIEKVRESILFIKRSPSRLHKFGEIARQLGINTSMGLCVDVPTRWNSTFKMLESAFYFKNVFPEYASRDLYYKWLPSADEWDQFDKIREVLSVFHSITEIFSGTSYPTSNRFLPNLITIKRTLDVGCMSDIGYISEMVGTMKSKFDKYWSDCSILFSIACILDPRIKLFVVNYYYPQIYDASIIIEKSENVKKALQELYTFYAIDKNVGRECGGSSSNQACTTNSTQNSSGKTDVLAGLYDYIELNSPLTQQKSDLEMYLEDPCVKCPDSQFNVLEWWKMSSLKYTILSKMAKDIFTILITTVASESAFSAGGRVLGDYRSFLSPKTINNLVCAANWIRSSYTSAKDPFYDIQVEEDLSVKIPETLTIS